ncbi:MAG: hypothetical protein Q7J35_15170 [Candidatus Methanoperedens sp.]|nr:hypothetical protein [Candidatus Methanoperedens sp.]
MKVYHVQGIRHNAVIFAETPEEAIDQAAEQDLVDDWEGPEAIEVPPPRGYRLIYYLEDG